MSLKELKKINTDMQASLNQWFYINDLAMYGGRSTVLNNDNILRELFTCHAAVNHLVMNGYVLEHGLHKDLHAGTFFKKIYDIGDADWNNLDTMKAVAASDTAMKAVAASDTAMKAVARSEMASKAISIPVQKYRDQVLRAFSNSVYHYEPVTVTLCSGAGTQDYELNTNCICFPVSCNDDNDTEFKVYNGCDLNQEIANIPRHSGTVNISAGIALRGVRASGFGASIGNVTFTVYNAL